MRKIIKYLIILVLSGFSPFLSYAQSYVPQDVWSTVNGYQDDFEGTTLKSGWTVFGANVYSVNNGVLRVTSASGDPNHLLYTALPYDNTVQEVLMRVRIINFGTGDPPRGGPSVCVNHSASAVGGINYHFRDNNGRSMAFLDDLRAWGPTQGFIWQNNVWYWVRLRHEPNAASQGGAYDVFGKIWLADGSTPEPIDWQLKWDYIPTRTSRTGYAGIAASSSGGLSEFEVDYILIKAAGLPQITVTPMAFVQIPVQITNQPQSQTVIELSPVTFEVGVRGLPTPALQWYRNGQPIPNATNATYSIESVSTADDGSTFYVVAMNVVSNISYVVTSAVATLTVLPDEQPPQLAGAKCFSYYEFQVLFSEGVVEQDATNLANYIVFANDENNTPLNLQRAFLLPDKKTVVVQTEVMASSQSYTVKVTGISDLSADGNYIRGWEEAVFTTPSYSGSNVNNSLPAGSVVTAQNRFTINGGGADISATADQFYFYYQLVNGDFDLQVRVSSFESANIWAKAGLMARESLSAGSKFASAIATPGNCGAMMIYRAVPNATAVTTGSFPSTYPNVWLRLKRSDDQFSAYGSYDGIVWQLLGSTNISMTNYLYLGFAVSSRAQGVSSKAVFENFSTVIPKKPATVIKPIEPLAQATRRTPIVVSEIMYNPYSPGAANYEFIELFNSSSTPEDLSNYRLDGNIEYAFPTNTVIPAGGYLVVARAPNDMISYYGITNVLGPYTGALPNEGGSFRLVNQAGGVMLEVKYDTRHPWSVAADGTGHSLVLSRPSLGMNDPRAWSASAKVGGSPGKPEPVIVDPLRNVVINEFLAHSIPPLVDYIELYNHSSQSVDISGCWLSDMRTAQSSELHYYRIPDGTVIPPGGFVVFDQNQMQLALNSLGDSIVLWNPARDMVIDAVRFEAQEANVSTGRFPDGSDEFYPLAELTPGAPNTRIKISDVIINEIMYAPISRSSDDEYVELYNRGSNVVDISGWRFVDGIDFTFPSNTFIYPNSYIVVAKNLTNILAKYPHLNRSNTFGNFSGNLANGGERIALAKWVDIVTTNLLTGLNSSSQWSLTAVQPRDFIIPTNANYLIGTNRVYVVVDEVTYGVGGQWGQWSRFGGSSLELIDPNSNKRLGANWADSDETSKAPWTIVNYTGYVDNGITGSADQLQVLLLGPGECLIDDVEVINSSGQNVVTNSTFEQGASGWVAEGTEETSSLETTEGYQSSRSYHIRAVDRGDNQINRVRINLSTPLAANSIATIRAKVRWLKGHPEILFRIRGCWLETVAVMQTPTNPGTPGLPNNRRVFNAPPAIYNVSHFPVVPATNEPLIVTAMVDDPDGVASVKLFYRIDPYTNYATVPMVDDGSGDDVIPGDGIYTAKIPPQNNRTLVAFYIEAKDSNTVQQTSVYPPNIPERECLVLFGDPTPSGNFPIYRLWMTQQIFNKWSSRHKLHNSPLPITFVYGNWRPIYTAEGLFAGSPYIAPSFNTPSGNRCGYSIIFQRDDRFLGDTDLVLDWPGGHGGETTAIQEQMAYWIADKLNLPFSYRYFIRLNVNGVTDMQRGSVFEAVLQPAGEYIEQWSYSNPDGEFYKIDRSFEFDDAGNRIADPMPRLLNYTSADGSKKTSRYRWTWLKRSYDSALNYTNLFHLVDALNATSPEPYTTRTEQLADVEQWMRVFAFEHIINNFDSWGHTIGKNMYTFKPQGGKWVLYPFDLDWLMLVSPRGPGGYTATTGPLFIADDPTVQKMYDHPPFRRAYLRAVLDAVNGPLKNSIADPVMDAKYNALLANGVTMSDGSPLTDPSAVKTWFNDRRNFLIATLNSNVANFSVTFPSNMFTTNNNLLRIGGTAPVEVETIKINGQAVDITWTSVSNWVALYPLENATNNLYIECYNHYGNPVSGASTSLIVYLSAPVEQPRVVISEIMYNPVVPGASYIELFNPSTNLSVNMSGWRIVGIDYVFPEGTILLPTNFILLAKDRYTFANTYGGDILVYDQFNGILRNEGEVLTLVKPASGGDIIVDRVRYESVLPWHQSPNGMGPSLQLIDPTRDNSRVANWSDGSGWRFFFYTGTLTPSFKRLMLFPDVAGEIYIDDIKLVVGPIPELGTNLIQGGDFEGAFLTNQGGFWGIAGTNGAQSQISTNVSHSGKGSLRLYFTGPGSPSQSINQDTLVNATNIYTLSFWYLPSTNITRLYARFSSTFRPEVKVLPIYYTPGASNSVFAPMPELPPVWLNEVQPQNISIIDNFGEHEPWIELYNSGTNAVDLSGWFLTDDYSNLTKWAFPDGAVIEPGEYLIVWADNEPYETQGTNFHTNFRLSPTNGSVALVIPVYSEYRVLDYLNYNLLLPGYSYGNKLNQQPFYRQNFAQPTPGRPNVDTSVVPVVINEFMANNDGLVSDPADNRFKDWFELYNYGTNQIDLSGFFLTDDLNDRFRFEIPSGYVIEPGGFLIVWADNSPDQNSLARPCFYVNFALSRNGESIGLFTPDGTLVDAITFGQVGRNEIRGRYPDGTGSIQQLMQATPGATNAPPLIPTNHPPIIVVEEQYYAMPAQRLTINVVATDFDTPAQILTFSISNAPAGASINPTTGVFIWDVPANQPDSTNYITVVVTDDGVPPLSSTAVLKIIVSSGNLPPSIQPVPDQLTDEETTLYVFVTATDPEAQQLTFTLDQAPAGAVINSATGVFQWRPTELQGPGTYTIIVRVTDNGSPPMSATQSFRIIVREVNSPPIIIPIPAQSVYAGQTLNLQIVASDSDVPVQTLTYSIDSTNYSGLSINSTNGLLRWQVSSTYTGTNVVTVRVTDSGNPPLSATRDILVVVLPQPKLEISRHGTDSVLLWFDTISGKTYSIQTNNNISTTNWSNIAPPFTGTGSKVYYTNSITPSAQKYYRLKVDN